MASRFFSDGPIDSDRVTLGGTEAHHLRHVMRAKVGQQVVLFDGSGWEFTACVTRLGRADVQLAITGSASVNRELRQRLVVGVALPKGDRQRWLVEKLVELGTAELVPLRTDRSTVHPNRRALGKLHRTVIEASKQCGRNKLMEINSVTAFDEYLARRLPGKSGWLADPAGEKLAGEKPGARPAGDRITEALVAIGPEGGFTVREHQLARAAGWQLVALGSRILRIETAALVMAMLAVDFTDSYSR